VAHWACGVTITYESNSGARVRLQNWVCAVVSGGGGFVGSLAARAGAPPPPPPPPPTYYPYITTYSGYRTGKNRPVANGGPYRFAQKTQRVGFPKNVFLHNPVRGRTLPKKANLIGANGYSLGYRAGFQPVYIPCQGTAFWGGQIKATARPGRVSQKGVLL